MQKISSILKLFLLTFAVLIVFSAQVIASSQFISIATGSTGGTYYPVGVILAGNFQDKIEGDYKFSAQASGGSRENLEMLRNKEVKSAIVNAGEYYNASTGTGDYKGKSIKNVRAVTALWPEAFQVVYRTGTGIESFKDFPGRKIAVGPAGGGATLVFSNLLKEIEGLSFDDFQAQFLGYSDSAQALQNRLIDACFLGGGVPTAAVSQLYASQVSVDIIEFSDEDVARVKENYPFYTRIVIDKGTYPGQEEDLNVMGQKSTLLVEESLSEDLVYEMLKSIYDHDLEKLKEKHAALESLSLEESLNGLAGGLLHPGALKFYQEYNVDIPDNLVGE